MILFPRGISLWLICFFFFGASTLTAQESPTWSLPRFSDDLAGVYQAASSGTAKKGSQVLVLHEEESYVYDSDGKSVRTTYRVYKILSEKGADGWDNTTVE